MFDRLSQVVLTAVCLLISTLAAAATDALEYRTQHLFVGKKAYDVSVPTGYRLDLITTDLESPRMLTFNDSGELFAGSRSGHVYRLLPPYTRAVSMVELNDYPHSIAFRPGEILIARTRGLYRAPYKAGQTRIDAASVELLAALPGGGGHNSRSVVIGPDGRVYLGLGLSGNCSDQYLGGAGYDFDERRGGVLVLQEEGDQLVWQPYASGLRNPVGIAWQPRTKRLYASNNGPDHWGFDRPPEYFSRLTPGSFHGMPWFQYDGHTFQRDDCVTSRPPRPKADVVKPVATFPSRNAPLGVTFVPAEAMDSRFSDDAIVALHGSWGTRPSGGFLGDRASRREPKIVAVRFANGEAQRVDDLVTGFQLGNGGRWARPAGVAIGPNGALYFSSDSETDGLFRLQRID